MDILSGLFYLFAIISTLYVVHFGIYLIGANFYDIWQYGRLHSLRPAKKPLAFPDLYAHVSEVTGLVSVAISARNEEAVIVRCLDSIRKSTYPFIEVLVADDASNDNTYQLVYDYAKLYPKMNLQVYRMHEQSGKGHALNTILKAHAKGEFVMTLDADSILRPDTVGNAVAYFEDEKIIGVAANVQIIAEPTVLGTLQKFEHMVGYRSKKTYSWLNCEFVVGGVASTYRMRVLRDVGFYDTDTVTEDLGLSAKIVSRGNRTERLVYGSDVVAKTEGVMTFRALVRQRYRWKYGSLQTLIKYHRLMFNSSVHYSATLTLYRMPMALLSELVLLLSPLAWGYVLYMTLTQQNLYLVIGAYITITAYVLVTLWFDENLSVRSRLYLTLYVPVSYFVFYVMDAVQLIAIVRCLAKSPALIRQKNVGSVWTSPERIGKRLANIE
jgi:cellulose synthase/poly-beta-1,6-N-acetylglucosamine synthase-like glycosyltransferase